MKELTHGHKAAYATLLSGDLVKDTGGQDVIGQGGSARSVGEVR